MFQHINDDYFQFIKNFLVNRCVIDYCSIINDKMIDYHNESYEVLIQKFRFDIHIWNDIFNKNYDLLKYYTKLCEIMNYTIPSNKIIEIFEKKSFQEFIDERINLINVGPYDYQQFTINMRDDVFKQNMINKHNSFDMECSIKNHIVYLFKLNLSLKIQPTHYYSDDEYKDIDCYLNVIPYYEYLSKQNLSTNKLNDDCVIFPICDTTNANYFKTLELSVLKIINNLL